MPSVEVLARRMRELEKARLLAEEERSHFLPTGWGSSKHGPGGQSKRNRTGVGWPIAKGAKETTRGQSPPRLRFQMLAVEY